MEILTLTKYNARDRELLALTPEQLLDLADLDAECLLELTPDVLREQCRRSPAVAAKLASALNAYRTGLYHLDQPERSWRGLLDLATPYSYAGTLEDIARALSRCDEERAYSPQEPGFEKRERAKRAPVRAAHSEGWKPASLVAQAAEEEVVFESEGDVHARKTPAQAEEVYLPALEDGQFAAPRMLVGSGLIGSGHSRVTYGPGNVLELRRFSGFRKGTTVIHYTGESLRVSDFETWMAILARAGKQPLGTRVGFTRAELLADLRRKRGGASDKALTEEILRLRGASIAIATTDERVLAAMQALMPEDKLLQSKRPGEWVKVHFSMLGAATEDRTSWSIEVSRTVRAIFGTGLSCWYDSEKYYALKSSTARRLFLLYMSHAKPWPFTLPELAEFLGLKYGQERDLRAALKKAHEQLVKTGALVGWTLGKSEERNGDEAFTLQLK